MWKIRYLNSLTKGYFNNKERIKLCKYCERTIIHTPSYNKNGNTRNSYYSILGYKKNYYHGINTEKNLNNILSEVDKILNSNNFNVYIKNKEENNENKLSLKKEHEIDVFKILNILNKILILIKEENDEFRINIWNNSTFKNLLSYIKLKIPIFNYNEMFLFILCFSKIQFIPQVLLEEVLVKLNEDSYLSNFFKDDVNKFFQFIFIFSSFKNLKNVASRQDFLQFVNEYINVILTQGLSNNNNNEQNNVHKISLDCCMLLCSAMYNMNIRNEILLHEVCNEIISLLNDRKIDETFDDGINVAKKIINIYFSYSSLGFNNYYFYEKLNSFLYNVVEGVPLSSSLTLLLTISTLKERKDYNFPLCLLSIIENKFINNFYALDQKDLLLLIYLFTYLKLYMSNYEQYVCMLDYLFNVHNFDLLKDGDANDKAKLVQIYFSLKGGNIDYIKAENKISYNNIFELQEQAKDLNENNLNGNINEKNISYAQNDEEKGSRHENNKRAYNDNKSEIKNIILKELQNKGVLQKIEQNVNGNMEIKEIAIDDDDFNEKKYEHVQEEIEIINKIINDKMNDKIFKINTIKKNIYINNYYFSHLYLHVEKDQKCNNKLYEKYVINLCTNENTEYFDQMDIYTNMKREHLLDLHIKYIPIDLLKWKNLSYPEKEKLLIQKLMGKDEGVQHMT
ncbi:conserved Plasmodium protein, unknown function [Plasmodium chabaudi chabaudi]|uniref:RAP domain-containing protein n=1 Tax=Plasmodium chabaudi chabaudi TaxID=31271 RepID=A0A4V0KA99_PLACU|nr:conserved Plasmodium protein, unknown function [Plasmodium chabaudi chabaudi]VTZ69163.1 conserved Plasmodium protein, unknown function [Plasmodium chabaudi chabaudi]|eukprot:XP_741013.2 conserved Plasmodium protein, unknown function [Plasmodium chabaudi chabaudi]